MRSTTFLAICVVLAVCAAGQVRAQEDFPIGRRGNAIRIPQHLITPIYAVPTALPIAATANAEPDRIQSITNVTMPCKILSIEPDGGVRFKTAWLKGESCADTKDLRRLMFGGAGGRGGKDTVSIVNGDVIEGTLKAMTTETVTIESSLMGVLEVPRGAVRRIECATVSSGLAGKDFGDGKMGPWRACSGTWKVTDGYLHCTPLNSDYAIAMPLEQKGSMTYEFKMAARSTNMRYQVFLYADSTGSGGNPQSYIKIRFYRTNFDIRLYDQARGSHSLGSFAQQAFLGKNPGSGVPSGTIRIACDVKKKSITVWINETQVASRQLPWAPKPGKFVILRNQYGERTEFVRIYKGVVPPPNVDSGDADKDRHLVVLANGDCFRSPTLTLTEPEQGESEGNFLTNVAGTVVPVPKNRVTWLIMPTQNHAPPRRCKGDARLRMGRSVVTLQVTSLKDGFLIGKSAYLGALKIPRKAVQRLDLNIYGSR